MTLNGTFLPNFQSQFTDHSMIGAELEEARMAKAQQNAATLLYLKNREEIWSTDKCALKGSNYSERIEEIEQGDQRTFDTNLDDDVIKQSLASAFDIDFSPFLTGKNAPVRLAPTQTHPSSTFEWLQRCENDISSASEVLKKIKGQRLDSSSIALLEGTFDKVDDLNILLDSLEVQESLRLYKSQILNKAVSVCFDIERAAKGLSV